MTIVAGVGEGTIAGVLTIFELIDTGTTPTPIFDRVQRQFPDLRLGVSMPAPCQPE